MTEFIHRGGDKTRQNQELFNAIAQRYDFLNHFLSLGLDLRWRRKLVQSLPAEIPGPVLDVATGTGDLAFTILKYRPDLEIIGVDNTPAMLEIARRKMFEQKRPYDTILSKAEELPFENDRFAALTIAFGLRNIGFYSSALNEFQRVLKPGGTLLILEFGQPTMPMFGTMFNFYFHCILPVIGALISSSKAYRYLPESVDRFPPRAELLELVARAGFENPVLKNLTGGVVTLLRAEKA
ncbi:MAG: bifunctional demethylmenaquinone methyltransferase/2-methoxy-6-polyprenyl-1,4-benzoquinol methylase UbiE [Candidatus Marinimicrobia bacterium]|nr:bifunctional demethylmenaquinone methyltransferase/2-methoxy-6-polyprenyl-1,4-benzoquinol methylase UbiE [Candidatus Neomarinimicrobiota bacterium]